jgi:RNA polymerase sigma-70 factor (ECF subfamily)
MDENLRQLEGLYRDMGPGLLAYFRGQPAVSGTAEDLLQDTFVRAMRNLDRLRNSVSPRAYLFGIARHACLDALRALARRKRLAVAIGWVVPSDSDRAVKPARADAELEAAGLSPSAAVECAGVSPPADEDPRLEMMREAIAALPPPQREVVELKLRHELSYEELAEVIGIPVGTVRSRLHYAMSRLHETLNPSSGRSPRPIPAHEA